MNVDAVTKGSICQEELQSSNQKEKNSLSRLDKLCLKFNLQDSRNESKSIYHSDAARCKDPYDVNKVHHGFNKTTKGAEKGALLSLSKQTKRDYAKLYHQSVGEAYANIKRDNAKADFIKKLLMQAQ